MKEVGPQTLAWQLGDSSVEHHECGKRKVREQESVVEHIQVLLASESKGYPCCKDYLSKERAEEQGSIEDCINEGWRRKLCEWCYEVVDHFRFDREVVSIALNYLDRSAASIAGPMEKKDFQLLAVTSLYIAIKTHGLTENFDGPRRKLKIEAFTQLSRGIFSVETIEAKEREILSGLGWKVNPPTKIRFISYLVRLLPAWTVDGNMRSHSRACNTMYELSRYLAELSVCVSKFSFSYKSSVIAYASILCVMDVLADDIPYDVRLSFLHTIAETTGLFPDSQEVLSACSLLKEICPSLFVGEHSTESSRAGKTSPVSVTEEFHDSPNSSRKRCRTCIQEAPPRQGFV